MQRRRHATIDDAGFTLAEVIVAISLITVVLAGATTFFVRSMAVTHLQGDRQTAVQMASDGMESIRAASGSKLGSWFPGDLAGCERRPGSQRCRITDEGSEPRTITMARTVNGIPYTQSWTIRPRNVPVGGSYPAAAMHQVTVRVQWPATGCAAGRCTYEVTTLISAVEQEPVFNVNGSAS